MAEGKEPGPDQQQKPGGPKLKMSRGVVSWLVFIGVALMLTEDQTNVKPSLTPGPRP